MAVQSPNLARLTARRSHINGGGGAGWGHGFSGDSTVVLERGVYTLGKVLTVLRH
jgi:hypothetical protein